MIEVLIEGPHGPARGREVTSAVLMVTVTELQDMGVPLEGVVLKPSMVLPDADGRGLAAPQIVAQQTLAALWCVVPEEVAGVAFMSGGQSPVRATASLAALRRLGPPSSSTGSPAATGPGSTVEP